ncbi:MAG: MBL fold metallo-hydrolase, partial [Alphaproteobacteria bacterium]
MHLSALILAGLCTAAGGAAAAPCLEVTLTGTQGGPSVFRGLAGTGTLVRYGDSETGCADLLLQFDAGRGTSQQLSKLGIPVGRLDAIFLTHMHSDHVEGLIDMAQLRWHFNSGGPKLDMICASDAEAPDGHVMSCRNFGLHIADALLAGGEIAQRLAENRARLPEGPAGILNIITFTPAESPQLVWQRGDVTVRAVRSTHVAGHVSFRVDTPAGSVVIGGDAGNDTPRPPRDSSTSAQVEALAKDADILVHSVIHPVMGPDGGSGFPPPIYFRQSNAADLGSLARRAGVRHLMLTHLIPPLGAARHGPWPVPGGALDAEDYTAAVRSGGYDGEVTVGTDLATVRLVA